MTEELSKLQAHTLLLEDRSRLKLSGVSDVDSFDETAVTAYTVQGELHIGGAQLRVISLNTQTGDLLMEGTVSSMVYLDNAPKKQSFLSRLLR